MGWITAILISGPARKALGIMLAAIAITLFLLNLRRAGERAGRLPAVARSSSRPAPEMVAIFMASYTTRWNTIKTGDE